ncbi:pseudaminic acid biosynthesis-associated methylase [Aestuariispira ectoiniformans]|uniref:pseudaminic acid biosynthesis-associated methylase n=1 Tax=Aestuariispira ectoiniformans TaxID=2775080 RepID=UPI00223C3AEA|nr:pseudaminic acid biosynthesis-associated methylase [Aestuariispira ectoiniformans]
MSNNDNVTPQGNFWQGEFGNEYTERNASDEMLAARRMMWKKLLPLLSPAPQSILEVGSNRGNNLNVLSELSEATLFAQEPNDSARKILESSGFVQPDNVKAGFGDNIPIADQSIDFVFTSGVLIHVAPEKLGETCDEMYRVSRQYIGCIEYFSPHEEEIAYRGHSERLFKRDFGGYWMDRHPDLQLIDYGFFWKRVTGLDDLTWWLFKKG